MGNIFGKLGKSATKAASQASVKAEEIGKIAKYKTKISSLRTDMGINKKLIGDKCVQLYSEDKIQDAEIKALCEAIEACSNEIEEIKAKIEQAKEESKAKIAEINENRKGEQKSEEENSQKQEE